ncbi:MAG TPA: DUF4412 domain-containing protein [Thermoanaerobaculia bacterium]|nr:DUF4412 domain-containing protein [Thermoanaerobaculia bacterium]
MRRNLFSFAALLLLAAVPATAGLRYQATTKTEGGAASTMTVEGWVSGEKAKVLFRESTQPMTEAGTYLLTPDGGKTMYLVNPEEKTYAEWDLQAMLGMAGALTGGGMGPMFKMDFSEPKVEKLLDEDGGTVAGLPTRHTRFRTSYTVTVKVMGMGNTSDVVTEQDLWTTDQLQDVGLGVWLRAAPRSGNEQLDKVIAAEMGKVAGFPLKSVTVSTTKGKKGKETVSRTTMEVTELDRTDVADSTFALPAGYQEIQLLPAGLMGRKE